MRNYEPFKDQKAAEEKLKEMRETGEAGNAMQMLENKTSDTKRDMDILDALEEIRLDNKRRSRFSVEDLLAQHAETLKNDGKVDSKIRK